MSAYDEMIKRTYNIDWTPVKFQPSTTDQDTLDAMRYVYNDIETTKRASDAIEEYNRYCRGSWKRKPEIKNVIFNNPATIVFWSDDTKTIVKCSEGDIFDPEKGLTMAIVKKLYGPTKSLNKWLPEEEKPVETSGIVKAYREAMRYLGMSATETLQYTELNKKDD